MKRVVAAKVEREEREREKRERERRERREGRERQQQDNDLDRLSPFDLSPPPKPPLLPINNLSLSLPISLSLYSSLTLPQHATSVSPPSAYLSLPSADI